MVSTPWVAAMSSASRPAPAPSRSTQATLAPKSASPAEKRRPRMPAAPVTTAVLPVRSNSAR